jgi:hypothetical protein
MELLALPEATYDGPFRTPVVWVPAEAACIRIVYTTPDWPDVPDGDLTWLFALCRDGKWQTEWRDTSQHQRIAKSPEFLTAYFSWYDIFDDGTKVPRPLGVPTQLHVTLAPTVAMKTALTVEAY